MRRNAAIFAVVSVSPLSGPSGGVGPALAVSSFGGVSTAPVLDAVRKRTDKIAGTQVGATPGQYDDFGYARLPTANDGGKAGQRRVAPGRSDPGRPDERSSPILPIELIAGVAAVLLHSQIEAELTQIKQPSILCAWRGHRWMPVSDKELVDAVLRTRQRRRIGGGSSPSPRPSPTASTWRHPGRWQTPTANSSI